MDQKAILPIALVLIIVSAIAGGVYLYTQNEDEEDEVETTQEESNNSEEETTQVMDEKNIVETAVNTPILSTLVAAVTAGDLVTTLSDETKSYTVFAPTNDAFAKIQSTVDTLLLPENKAQLQSVLTYHVVSGEAFSSDLSDGQVIKTVQGDNLTVDIRDGKVYINDAMVVSADIETANGVVHVIDTVLVP